MDRKATHVVIDYDPDGYDIPEVVYVGSEEECDAFATMDEKNLSVSSLTPPYDASIISMIMRERAGK